MTKTVDLIETDRLQLRGIDESDAITIVKWRSDPNIFCFFKNPHVITLDEHLAWFFDNYLHNEDRFDWMCISKTTEEKSGVFGLVRKDKLAEINYMLAPEAQHKGYAREAVSALIKYAVEKWNSEEIIAEIHKDNIDSIRFIERLNFKIGEQQGEFIVYHREVKE